MTGSLLGRWRRAASSDDGFTLIEVLAALVVFAILSVSVIAALLQSVNTSRQDRRRVAAANVASGQIEQMRNLPTSLIPDGTTTLTRTVDGTAFTVTQTVAYVPDTSTVSSCDSGATGGLAYKRIQESVTWPQMNNAAPVRSDTLRAVNIAGLNPALGALAVAVRDANANGVAGVVVSATATGYSQNQTTGSDGCVVFANVPPGTATAQIGAAGYLDRQSVTAPSQNQTITGSTIGKLSFDYDIGGSLAAQVLNANAPATLGITAYNSGLQPLGVRTWTDCYATSPSSPCATGTGVRVLGGKLFPVAYSVWAGTCSDADPAATVNGGTRPTPVTVPRSGSVTASVSTTPVQVTNRKATAVTYYAVHAVGGTCGAGESYPITAVVMPANTTATFALPLGQWVLTTTASPTAITGGESACNLSSGGGTAAPCYIKIVPSTTFTQPVVLK